MTQIISFTPRKVTKKYKMVSKSWNYYEENIWNLNGTTCKFYVLRTYIFAYFFLKLLCKKNLLYYIADKNCILSTLIICQSNTLLICLCKLQVIFTNFVTKKCEDVNFCHQNENIKLRTYIDIARGNFLFFLRRDWLPICI